MMGRFRVVVIHTDGKEETLEGQFYSILIDQRGRQYVVVEREDGPVEFRHIQHVFVSFQDQKEPRRTPADAPIDGPLS